MRTLSFRLKIALLSAAISGLVLVAFSLAVWFLISEQKLASMDTEIRSLGARHPGWIANRGNYQRLDEALAFIFGEAHQNQVGLLVKDASGTVLHTSAGWPSGLDPASLDCTLADDPKLLEFASTNRDQSGIGMGRGRGGMGRGLGPGGGIAQVTFTKVPRFQTVTTAGVEWRLGMLGTPETTLVIALNNEAARSELNRIRNGLLLALPISLFVVGLGGWLVAGRALRPMRVISKTAERVTASGLDKRIPESNEDPEIARVIQVLNRMMDRLETSFRQATRFSADASHELKTPLAIMQGELENAIQASPPGSPEQRVFNNLLDETQHLKRITSNLLLLAQADSGQLKLALEEIPLSTELEAMIEDAHILAAESNIQFNLDVPLGVTVRGDRGLLRMALLNLIKNAVRYNEPGGSVGLTLTVAQQIELTICNTGPGIPPADQPRVFERFYRARQLALPSGDGLGLGLSLAREIILAHKGTLVLKESRPGYTCFTVCLKRDPAL